MSNHGRRATDGSRPADDTGRRPEVLAGVGPIINMQRGEAAHDGGGVLSSDSQRQPRVVPPVLKEDKEKF